MVDLVGIQSNIVKIDQIISRTSGHLKPMKPHSDRKVSHWNLDRGHLSYLLAPLRKLGPAVGYANISGSICSLMVFLQSGAKQTFKQKKMKFFLQNFFCLGPRVYQLFQNFKGVLGLYPLGAH